MRGRYRSAFTTVPQPALVDTLFEAVNYVGSAVARALAAQPVGVDLSAGGMALVQNLDSTFQPLMFNTLSGAGNLIHFRTTTVAESQPTSVTGFSSNGINMGVYSGINALSNNFAAWLFRKAPKFFTIVQYTGNGAASRSIAHDLGVQPALMNIVATTGGSPNQGWCLGLPTANHRFPIYDTSYTSADSTAFGGVVPTSTTFNVGALCNVNGTVYQALLWANDQGPASTIRGGTYVGNGLADGPQVDVGFEPSFIITRSLTTVSAGQSGTDMWGAGLDAANPRTKVATWGPNAVATRGSGLSFNANGFKVNNNDGACNNAGTSYFYLAIRKGG